MEGSIDMLTTGEFVYAFLGYIIDTNDMSSTAEYELKFLKTNYRGRRAV